MGRPRLVDDHQLLDAARAVFLERGASATTAEVARRVGVSQAAIFKRFRTKQQLFLAAMVSGSRPHDFVELLRRRSQSVGLRQALIEVGDKMLPFFRQVLPLLLMSWSSRGEFGLPPELAAGEYGPGRAAREIVTFLEGEMKAGRLRKHRPALVARAFVGSLQHYVLVELIAHGGKMLGVAVPPKAYVRGVVDVLWQGIAPHNGSER
jgi:AcrR family transcriptional regulator